MLAPVAISVPRQVAICCIFFERTNKYTKTRRNRVSGQSGSEYDPNFIYKLLKQYREKRTLVDKSHGGGQSLKLSPENIIVLGELVEHNKHTTSEELKEQLHEQNQVLLSNSTISRVLTRLGLTRQKKHSMPVKNKPNEFKIYAQSTDNK
jgi:transposase